MLFPWGGSLYPLHGISTRREHGVDGVPTTTKYSTLWSLIIKIEAQGEDFTRFYQFGRFLALLIANVINGSPFVIWTPFTPLFAGFRHFHDFFIVKAKIRIIVAMHSLSPG